MGSCANRRHADEWTVPAVPSNRAEGTTGPPAGQRLAVLIAAKDENARIGSRIIVKFTGAFTIAAARIAVAQNTEVMILTRFMGTPVEG
jgi:hypothetical protein